MITRYQFGTPILNTEAVVRELPVSAGAIPGFTENPEAGSLTYTMPKDAIVYGLGETVRGMNKRGWHYISNNTDDPNHTETTTSLYASQNFLLIFSKEETFGLFVDHPGWVEFDIGFTDADSLILKFREMNMDVYRIDGSSLTEIIREYRELIGPSYVPPKWAFGFGQSRWGYGSADNIREVLKNYRDADIPIDMIYLDIDYMLNYKDFTVDPETFPDFPELVSEMKEQGIHLIPIIDAGVKLEKGYAPCDEGVEHGYFVTDENGEPFVGAVWPGLVHFPDVLNPDARRWFGSWYNVLIDAGIDGFWNDMNEPAIFYSPKHLEEVYRQVDEFRRQELTIDNLWEFFGAVTGIQNYRGDYESFYHLVDGERIRHDRVHNLYGYNLTRAAQEAFRENYPDREIMLFSRSSYVGMHRYSGVWTGDNCSWWSHLKMLIAQLPALNMSGFLFSGADVGGFGSDTTEDLLLRFTALGIFTPLFRNHSAHHTRFQEVYRFPRVQDLGNLIRLRYALIPYLYQSFCRAAAENTLYFSPLSFVWSDDERAIRVEDELLVGDSILIAPVYEQNAKGRVVYLPEEMKLLRFRSPSDYDEEILSAGDHYVSCETDEVLIFLRRGCELPLAKVCAGVQDTDEIEKIIRFE